MRFEWLKEEEFLKSDRFAEERATMRNNPYLPLKPNGKETAPSHLGDYGGFRKRGSHTEAWLPPPNNPTPMTSYGA